MSAIYESGFYESGFQESMLNKSMFNESMFNERFFIMRSVNINPPVNRQHLSGSICQGALSTGFGA